MNSARSWCTSLAAASWPNQWGLIDSVLDEPILWFHLIWAAILSQVQMLQGTSLAQLCREEIGVWISTKRESSPGFSTRYRYFDHVLFTAWALESPGYYVTLNDMKKRILPKTFRGICAGLFMFMWCFAFVSRGANHSVLTFYRH